MSNQITSFYIFNIKKPNRYSALVKMAYAAILFRRVKGCTFAKVMGSGGGILGFGLFPNFRIYTIILTWEHPDFLEKFESSNWLFTKYLSISSSIQKIYGKAYKAHGKWDGIQPFTVSDTIDDANPKTIVLTRARIKFGKIRAFWRYVPMVSDELAHAQGRIFSIGIGEFPLILQATLSIWESEKHMQEYAYKNEFHIRVIRKTKELNWYSEELFARFYEVKVPNLTQLNNLINDKVD